MNGLIFHTLKGIRGEYIYKMDVYKILNVKYKKRLFCIFDRDYPYDLEIEYNEPIKCDTIETTYTNKGFIYVPMSKVHLTQFINNRYKTEIDVKNEINEILIKQNKIKLLRKKLIDSIDNID